MKLADVRKIAAQLGLKTDNMKKAEIIVAIQMAEGKRSMLTLAVIETLKEENMRMKKSIWLMLMVASLLTAMPVLAADTAKNDPSKECVIRCVVQSESITEKINRLKTEIASGKNTYSTEELQMLEKKLNEANEMLKSLERPH